MFKITIEADEIIKALDLSSKRFMDNTAKAMDAIVKEGKKIMVREAPEGTGKLKKGIQIKVEKGSKVVVGTVDPSQEYAIFIEKGRGSGGKPPLSAIRKWAMAKGIPSTAAYAIAKRIGEGRSGSNRPNPFVERTFEELKDIVEDELEKAISKTTGAL